MVRTKEMTSPDSDTLQGAGIASDRLRRELDSWARSGAYQTPQSLYQTTEDLFLILGSIQVWPRSAWRLLMEVCDVASAIEADGKASPTDWRRTRISADVLAKLERLAPKLDVLVNPPPDEGPRHIRLETIEQLTEQKVPDRQIARIYEWTDRNGQPDVDKVRRCRAGEVKAPIEVIRAPADGQPAHCPHAGRLHSAADTIASWRDLKPADVLQLVQSYVRGDVDEDEPEEVQDEV